MASGSACTLAAVTLPGDLWGRLTRDERHGPLGGLMIVLTAVTGMVDAVSILRLGHVFVANMTGNVVFIGFGAAGAPGFPIYDSLVAIAAFLVGAFAGGQLEAQWAGHRARALRLGAGVQAVGLLVATVIAAIAGSHPHPAFRYVLLVLLAAGMGLQNAVVRRLAVPDLTTTVLTMTLTGLASDLRTTRARPGQVPLRVGSWWSTPASCGLPSPWRPSSPPAWPPSPTITRRARRAGPQVVRPGR
jgi:uncharacterized membrane protein YoaK (UPF0700 family)